jgi:hypothetical protein
LPTAGPHSATRDGLNRHFCMPVGLTWRVSTAF